MTLSRQQVFCTGLDDPHVEAFSDDIKTRQRDNHTAGAEMFSPGVIPHRKMCSVLGAALSALCKDTDFRL